MKRKHHSASWAIETNSCPVKPSKPIKLRFHLGQVALEVDDILVDVSSKSVRNMLEEMGDLGLLLKTRFKEGISMEKITPDFANIDLEEQPTDFVCLGLDKLDRPMIPENLVSKPNEIGNISLIKEKPLPILLQGEDLAVFFENVAKQCFELLNAIVEHREPRFFGDLSKFFDPEMYNIQPRAKYEQKALKHALKISEIMKENNDLWTHYKDALHEINLLTKTIQGLLMDRNFVHSIRMKPSHRNRSRNATTNSKDELLSQLFSFFMKQKK